MHWISISIVTSHILYIPVATQLVASEHLYLFIFIEPSNSFMVLISIIAATVTPPTLAQLRSSICQQ